MASKSTGTQHSSAFSVDGVIWIRHSTLSTVDRKSRLVATMASESTGTQHSLAFLFGGIYRYGIQRYPLLAGRVNPSIQWRVNQRGPSIVQHSQLPVLYGYGIRRYPLLTGRVD